MKAYFRLTSLLFAALLLFNATRPLAFIFLFVLGLRFGYLRERLHATFIEDLPFYGLLGFLITVFTWMISYGHWNLLEGERYGIFFDELGRNLLHGRTDLDPAILGGEAIIHHGRAFTNFGVFPAFLRVLPNLLLPGFYGHSSRLSCLVAGLLLLLAFGALIANALQANDRLTPRRKSALFILFMLGFGLGSPVFYLMSCGFIYHEAILWGLAGALWSLNFFLQIAYGDESNSNYFLFFLGSTVTLLSRVTFALPFILLMPAVLFLYVKKNGGKQFGLLVLYSSPLWLAGFYQAWYNWDRFGSIFTLFPLAEYPLYKNVDPGLIPVSFDFHRIGTTLPALFSMSKNSFDAHFPWFHALPGISYDMANDYVEWILPMSLVSLWSVYAAVRGAAHFLKQRPLIILSVYALAAQAVLVLSFFFVTERYTAELLPLMILMLGFYLRRIEKGFFVIPLLVGISVVLMILGTFDISAFHNWGIPTDQRAEFVRWANVVASVQAR